MAETTDPDRPRVIKRYANRKLYDMSESCYITHDEIADLVRRGEEIRIIDNRTKEDLTSATLTQILFDKERKSKASLPVSTLRRMFQQSGDFINERITQPLTSLRDEAEKNVRKVFGPRGSDDEGGGEAEVAEPEVSEASSAAGKAKPADAIREWMQGTQQAYEHMQKNVEERVNMVVGRLGQFDINHKRIVELERRVEALEQRLSEVLAERDVG